MHRLGLTGIPLVKASTLAAVALGVLWPCIGAPPVWASVATTTTLTITSGSSPVSTVPLGTVVTLTAVVTTGGAPLLPAQVDFCDAAPPHCTDIHLLGTAQMTAAGTATIKVYPGRVGSHTYTAVFPGTNVAASSSSNAMPFTVTPGTVGTTSTSLTATGAEGDYTLTTTVTGFGATAPPTGTISFLDTSNANYALGAATLVTLPAAPTNGLDFDNSFSIAWPYQTLMVAVADFNGDGKPDVAVVDGAADPFYTAPGPVNILLGNGHGTFTSAPGISVSPSSPPYAIGISIAVGDFNQDGKPDLAVITNSLIGVTQELQVFLGNGDGTFTAGQTTSLPGCYFVATGDFNRDGIPDLAVTNTDNSSGMPINTVSILLGSGDGTFTLRSTSPTGNTPIYIAVGDFNGDGNADLAIANHQSVEGHTGDSYSSTLTILLGNGDGTFTASPVSPVTPFSQTSVVAADFNGDGILDLAMVSNAIYDLDVQANSGTVSVFLGNGDGTFAPTATDPLTAMGGNFTSVAVADINGDGNADLVTAEDESTTIIGEIGMNGVSVQLGNGDGTFAAPLDISVGFFPYDGPNFVVTADFNGDGLPDIAVALAGMAYPSDANVAVELSELAPQSATATITGISPVGTGIHLVDANFPGDISYQPSVSNTVELVAEPVATGLTLSAKPNSIYFGQPVTLTATLSPLSVQNHSATGTINFTAGSTALGVGAIPNFTVTTTSLPIGMDSVTAMYSGDANFSLAYAYGTVKVLTPDFTIAVSPTPVDVAQGASTNTVVTLTPLGAFTQTLQLSCSGLPTFAACSFSPASLTPGTTVVTSTLTITTRLQKAALANHPNDSPAAQASPIAPWSLFALPGCLRGRRRRLSWRAQRVVRGMFVAGLLAAALAFTGCAPNSILFIASPTGTYPLTITAASATLSHTVNLVLTITN